MKRWMVICLFFSNFSFAQNEVAFLSAYSSADKTSSETALPESFAPFVLINGMMVVEAKINGQLGNFILDTGAPGIILNSKNIGCENTLEASSVGGDLKVEEVKVAQFEWGNIRLNNLEGFAIDISHLEEAAQTKLNGLIGFEVFKDVELFFDFENHIVKIFPARKSELHQNAKPSEKINFELQGHIPVISVKVGAQTFRMGLDSGAEVNLIDNQGIRKLTKEDLSNVRREELRGLDGNITREIASEISSTEIKSVSIPNMKFLSTDFSILQKDYGLNMDGLLGYPFFKSTKVSINYKKRKLYFW